MAIECWGASIDFIVRSDRHKQDNLFVFVLDETKYDAQVISNTASLDDSPRKTRKVTEGKKRKKLRESISSCSTNAVQVGDLLQLFHFREFPCFPWFLMNYPVECVVQT